MYHQATEETCAADLPTALARVSAAWLIAMPVAACNLILVTAAEGNDLVGDSFFGHVLPLAARGAIPRRLTSLSLVKQTSLNLPVL